MTASKFSWLKAIAVARTALPLSANECLRALRDQVRTHPLLGFELEMLGRFLRDVPNTGDTAIPEIRVAIVSGYTSDPIVSAMRVALLAEGFRAEVYEARFGVYRQEMLSPSSALYAFDPKIILVVSPSADIAGMPVGPMSQSDIELELDREVKQWRSLWEELHKHSTAVILQHTFESPDVSYLGIAERSAFWGPARFIAALNERLIAASCGAVHWVDVDYLATTIGRRNWHDPRLKYHGKLAFSSAFLPEYTTLLGAALRSALGYTRKALIVDLDNTLWSGVLGDDGLEGILLGPDTPEGEAYQAFCRYVGDLGLRGVILGICSKNEITNVVEIFERHRHMPLKLDDFAVVRCNWEDKASNLAAIALELNIDVSAIVFVDDNPAECELVRQVLPSVHVVQMDGDPASFIRRLDRERLFDSQGYSDEDIKRSKSYIARAKTATLQASAPDLETYLTSMEMHGRIWRARHEDIPRLAQMEIKTNQFNMTTRRWTAEQIRRFIDSDDHDVFSFQLTDRFADHGLVGTICVRYQGAEVVILSWLLSCRVFSRTCEEFMLSELIKSAIERGFSRIIGEYIPTDKNKVVANLFTRLGFVAADNDGLFALEISNASFPQTYISINAKEDTI
jgi:FkbH-like protein